MASVVPRENRNGVVVSYQVKWRAGGARDGGWQTERFDDVDAANDFRDAVNLAGQQWPPGWVKGLGYINPDVAEPDEDVYRFERYALKLFELKTGIEEHYRQACIRDLRNWVLPVFGHCDVRSTEHFNSDTVSAWVRSLEQTKVRRGQMPKKGEPKWRTMSPKTIRNLHGLLSEVLEKAVKAEPPLRDRNPCALTVLPRADDDGGEDGEDIEFLTPDEVEGVIKHMEQRRDQLLAIIKYGTGMRWGEVTALAGTCLVDWGTAAPKIRVKRAWKKDGQGGYYLGKPKSKRSRRTLRVSWAVVEAVNELGGEDRLDPTRLYFTGSQGQRLHYSTFYDRWNRAVRRAKAEDLVPRDKRPTPHDLRHSHAAVLLSEGRGLTYVQRRLGHESIKTTSDTYGHLLPEADDAAMDIIDRSLGRGRPELEEIAAAAVPGDRSRVHVVHLDGEFSSHVAAFWARGDAAAVGDQWQVDNPEGTVRVETWAADWWRRQQNNGLKDVRDVLPDRARIWAASALYLPDGSPFSTGGDSEIVAARWVWEWEKHYTDQAAECGVGHLPGTLTLTQAEAWGRDENAVRLAFAEARSDALGVCAAHPEAVAAAGGTEPAA